VSPLKKQPSSDQSPLSIEDIVDQKDKPSDELISYNLMESIPEEQDQPLYDFEKPILWEGPLNDPKEGANREYDPEGPFSQNPEGHHPIEIKDRDNGEAEKDRLAVQVYDPSSPAFQEDEILEIRKEKDPYQEDEESQEKELLEKVRGYTYAPYPYDSLQAALYDLRAHTQPGRLKKSFAQTLKDFFQLIRRKVGQPPLQTDFSSIKPVHKEASYLLSLLEGKSDEGVRPKSQRLINKAQLVAARQEQRDQAMKDLSAEEKRALENLSQYTEKPYTSLLEALGHLSAYKQPGRLSKDFGKAIADFFRVALAKAGAADESIENVISSVPMRKEAARIQRLLQAVEKE
jgi:hypothetical protein